MSDRPVLLLHGGGVAGWMWDPLRTQMGAGNRFIVPDLPGHDHSAHEIYRSHDQTIAELESLLAGEASPVTVIGFSLGAQLAIMLAARRPDLVDRVVVISAQAKPTRAPGLTLALLGATAGLAKYTWFARLQAKALFIPPELLDDYLRTSSTVSRDTLLAAVGENIRFTIPARWGAFPGHALILAGSKEQGIMRSSAEALHDALPHSTGEIVEGAGHGVPLQKPVWLARRLDEWFVEAAP
ncbi:alpha/beta fold hydrolase [Microbacterium sp. A93]|uniref:alpha/beta fold hydrolase n=1 Tax=unclassified Microbacterium TaxID=2609290 RepID=UPI003F43AE33